MRIRRQLVRTPGCLRFASIIAGPREFWTITVWASRDKMLDFMRSGAHEDIMWLFGRWLDSFWLARWQPSSDELGRWKNLALAGRPQLSAPRHDDPGKAAALEAALDAVPGLKAAAGPSGAPSYEYAPSVRRRRARVAGGVGATIRIEVPHWWQTVSAWRDLLDLRRRMSDHPDVLRWAVGMSRPREVYALAILRDERVCREFLNHPDHLELRERWGDGYWSMRWLPANEFGHWDGLRLRREKLGSVIHVPEAAAAAADYTPRGQQSKS